jgi:hypothetical protein
MPDLGVGGGGGWKEGSTRVIFLKFEGWFQERHRINLRLSNIKHDFICVFDVFHRKCWRLVFETYITVLQEKKKSICNGARMSHQFFRKKITTSS